MDNSLFLAVIPVLLTAILGWARRDDIQRWYARARARNRAATDVAIEDELTVFRTLIPVIEGDEGNDLRQLIKEGLNKLDGFQVQMIPENLPFEEWRSDAEDLDRCNKILRKFNRHLLIAGRAVSDQAVVRLRMVSDTRYRPTNSYRLDDTLDLPSAFDEHATNMLAAAAMGSLAISNEQSGRFLVDHVAPLVERARLGLDTFEKNLDRSTFDGLRLSLGWAQFRLGEQSGRDAALEQAVLLARSVADRAEASQQAQAQMLLGTALSRLGEREGGPACLDAAITTYRLALEVRLATGCR